MYTVTSLEDEQCSGLHSASYWYYTTTAAAAAAAADDDDCDAWQTRVTRTSDK